MTFNGLGFEFDINAKNSTNDGFKAYKLKIFKVYGSENFRKKESFITYFNKKFETKLLSDAPSIQVSKHLCLSIPTV